MKMFVVVVVILRCVIVTFVIVDSTPLDVVVIVIGMLCLVAIVILGISRGQPCQVQTWK